MESTQNCSLWPLEPSDITIKCMNRASVTVEIEGDILFMSRRVLNTLLRKKLIHYSIILVENNSKHFRWVAMLSAF